MEHEDEEELLQPLIDSEPGLYPAAGIRIGTTVVIRRMSVEDYEAYLKKPAPP